MPLGWVVGFWAALGAAVGSFLNVAADRLPARGSLLAPPSQCDACGRRLNPIDLVPVVSYLALRGRCRTCEAPGSAGASWPWRWGRPCCSPWRRRGSRR